MWQAWFGERLGTDVSVERRNVSSERIAPELSDSTRADLVDYFEPEYAVHSRLQETGEWSGARGTALAVPTRPRKAKPVFRNGQSQKS